MKNAGWDEPQHELLAVDVDGVPGVVSSLISGHDVEVRSEKVDDLAFAFITPLRAENCEIHKMVVIHPRACGRVVGSECDFTRVVVVLQSASGGSQEKKDSLFD